MSYLDRDPLGIYRNSSDPTIGSSGPGPKLMGAETLIGDDVYNHKDEDLGDIKEIMLDMRTGKIAYAVLSFGGVLGMGKKLFAVPWDRLTLDTVNKRFLLDVDKERLENAPGFDKNNWPDMTNDTWTQEINRFYGGGAATGGMGATATGSMGSTMSPGTGGTGTIAR